MALNRRNIAALTDPNDIGGSSGIDDGIATTEKSGFGDLKGASYNVQSIPPSEEAGLPAYDVDNGREAVHHPANTEDILTHTLHLDDDPSLNSLTFRTWFLGKLCTEAPCIRSTDFLVGIGLSLFGGTISSIYFFKPTPIIVSVVFVAVISYVLGEFLAFVIPRRGWIGRWLNPQPFNSKEHVAIVIMANAASISSLGMQLLAVQRLYYNAKLNAALSIFLLVSSQLLGYGIAGLMRRTLVYPKRMLWPVNLPVSSMLETLYRPKAETRKGLKVFGIVFGCIFCWEIIPQWIMPILTGVSIFCLANQNSAVFTNIFGGTNGNEGLGLFSWCMDWQYIASLGSPLIFPMDSLISQGIGTTLCIVVFAGAYYTNVWNAQKLPFISQVLFSDASNSTNGIQWNQTAVIGPDNIIDKAALAIEGLPWFATSYVIALVVTNMAVTAAITHLSLYFWPEVKEACAFISPTFFKRLLRPRTWKLNFWESGRVPDENQDHYDPHYKLMLAYKPCPNWWYGVVLILSVVAALVVLYEGHSTLPWWGILVSCITAYVCITLFGSMQAITGIPFIIMPIVQMIGGYVQPGYSVANMYFTLYGYSSMLQGNLLSSDLKLAQYCHLAPRVAFTMQVLGSLIGSVFNYVMMNSIVDNQRDILLSVEGSNIWSGQQVQQYNSLVSWF